MIIEKNRNFHFYQTKLKTLIYTLWILLYFLRKVFSRSLGLKSPFFVHWPAVDSASLRPKGRMAEVYILHHIGIGSTLYCLFLYGRGERIRTSGLCVPNAALYQTEPHLDIMEPISGIEPLTCNLRNCCSTI